MKLKKFLCMLVFSCFLVGCEDNTKQEQVEKTDKLTKEEQLKLEQEIKQEEELEKKEDFLRDFFSSKSIYLESYEDVLGFNDKVKRSIEDLLVINKIEYVSSKDNSFICSKKNGYSKFENDYYEMFFSNIDVNYNDGMGSFDIFIEKQFHKDTKLEFDSYISLIYSIYKEFNPYVTQEEFLEILNEAINRVINGGYNIPIESKSNLVRVNVSLEDSTISIRLLFRKPIETKKLETTLKEYNSIEAFKKVNTEINPDKYVDKKIRDKNENYLYTLFYSQDLNSNFSENIGFKFTRKKDIEEFKKEKYSMINTNIVDFNEESSYYLDDLIEKFNNKFSFYIPTYISGKQILDEVQSIDMKEKILNQDFIKEKYDRIISPTIPIPGIYELKIDENSFTINIKRDVLAEGIKSK